MLPEVGERLLIGAMSGTSADGVDAAVVALAHEPGATRMRLLAHLAAPFHPSLRREILEARSAGQMSFADLTRLGRQITEQYASAARGAMALANVKPGDVAAIAAHGQTLFHAPPFTLQWLDPALLAWLTDCAVISDFRRTDCAAGGQGAPLVPLADFLLLAHPTRDRIALNLGGIANLTWLRAGGSIEQLIAFDTGPGNCIIDWVCRSFDPDGPGYDPAGALAATAEPCRPLCQAVLADAYFSAAPPKSTDGPAMIQPFAAAMQSSPPLPTAALLRTACTVTAESVAGAIRRLPGIGHADVIVSGGGTANLTLMDDLRRALGGCSLVRSEELGLPSAAKEAIAFALLGGQTLQGRPGNVPSVTGARRAVVLGAITPRP